MLGLKESLAKFKKIEIISGIFSDHNAMRLEIKLKGEKTVQITNTWRLSNMLLNSNGSLNKSMKELKRKKNA